jgi:K+-transporting ATPase ATPase A chain
LDEAVPLLNMSLGEMIFGSLGTGIYSIIMVALAGLFVTGLMIGRTPKYLGKRIEPSEMTLLILYTLTGPLGILGLTALALGPIIEHLRLLMNS